MKIAFISTMNGAAWGGSEELWFKTALYALREGHKVLISVFDWGKLHPNVVLLKQNGAQIHLRELFNSEQSLWKKTIGHFKHNYRQLNKTYQDIFKFEPDTVLISQGETYDVVVHHKELYRKLILSKIPYSVICHSNHEYSFIPNASVYPEAKEFFVGAKKVFIVAQKMLRVIQRQLCMDIPNVQLVWNPVNISNCDSIDYPITENIEFAAIGYLGFAKGQDTLFEVLKAPKWRNRSWKLNIYGNGYGLQYLQELAKYCSIEDKVIFHGYVNDMRKVWEKNHALLMGSSIEWMPLSLMEAMLCGRVSIVPDIGGISELTINSHTSFIAASPSADAIDLAMTVAWDRIGSWEKMGINAHEQAKSMIDLNPEQTLLAYLLN